MAKRFSPTTPKGRGTASTLSGRFAVSVVELDETGEPRPNPATELRTENASSIITGNQSPDVPFNLSVNPYRGCEHGCIYCFARPSHAYLDLSPGIDFETRLAVKGNAPELFEAELRKPGYILLRLPHEVAPLFVDWLKEHFPDRAGHVISRLTAMRGGRLYDSRFGERMSGRGIFADLIRQRFDVALRRNHLTGDRLPPLDCGRFQPPPATGDQLSLW